MAKIVGLFPSAVNAVKMGSSFRQWERDVRALGLGARSSEMNQLFRLATQAVSRAGSEIGLPLDQVPSADVIQPWPVKKATGFSQTVTLVYRDNITGKLNSTWYRTRTDQPLSRQEIINQAISAYSGSAEEYEQELVGSAYTSTSRYVQMG